MDQGTDRPADDAGDPTAARQRPAPERVGNRRAVRGNPEGTPQDRHRSAQARRRGQARRQSQASGGRMSIPTVERRRFKVGKYDIIAHPIPNSAHMLRYTVFVGGKRIGATVSVPTESDCRFLEKPPIVPPLKIFSSYRPGRPKKGSRPPAAAEPGHAVGTREALPLDVSLGGIRATTDR